MQETGEKVSDVDRARLAELRRTAVDALTRMNEIIARYRSRDADGITHMTIGLRLLDKDAVPPVWEDPCTHVTDGAGNCGAYCDPPGTCTSEPC